MSVTEQGEAEAATGSDRGLTVERIGKSFRGRAVVKNVSLTLKRGEVAGLLLFWCLRLRGRRLRGALLLRRLRLRSFVLV